MKKKILFILVISLNTLLFSQKKEGHYIYKKIEVVRHFKKVAPCGFLYNIGIYKAKVLDSNNQNILIYAFCEGFNDKLSKYGIAKLEIFEDKGPSDRIYEDFSGMCKKKKKRTEKYRLKGFQKISSDKIKK